MSRALLRLLQVRLSWRRTAACWAPDASSAVSMADADTALPALLQGLHRGADTRCCPEIASLSNLGSEELCDHLSQATCVDHIVLHVDSISLIASACSERVRRCSTC